MKTKLLLFFLIIFLGLGLNSVVFAQENETDTTEETIKAEDLDIAEPNLLPDSPFYFLKEWRRRVQSFFTFGQIKKSELEQKFASERLMELREITKQGKGAEIIEKATKKYEESIEKLKSQSEKIKEKVKDSEKVESFLEKFTKQQLLHQIILEKLETQVPEEVFEKIKEARETHLEKFEQVMNKLENREEIRNQIREKAQETIQETWQERKCKMLWWHDNDTQQCQQKNFCGAFMYYGLRTFENNDDCVKDLDKNEDELDSSRSNSRTNKDI